MDVLSNLKKLPRKTYWVEQKTGDMITIMRGEDGFYKMDQQYPKSLTESLNCTMKELAIKWNKENNVTPAQMEAMSWGSMFGWDIPLADIDHESYL